MERNPCNRQEDSGARKKEEQAQSPLKQKGASSACARTQPEATMVGA